MTATCVLFFGDDIIAAAGDTSGRGLDGRLQALLADTGTQSIAYNLGIVGETAVDVSRRWRKESYPRTHRSKDWHPFFCFGANDALSSDEAGALQALHKVITRCLEDELQPFILGPPPIGSRRRRAAITHLSRRFAATCGEYHVAFCETAAHLATSTEWNADLGDAGDQPGAAAYDELARVAAPDWLDWLLRRSR